MNIEKLSPEFVKDLIPFLASLNDLPKEGCVKYGQTAFRYTLLDCILDKIKSNDKFAFMQPLGYDENGAYIQCILAHTSGEVITSDKFPLFIRDGAKMQDIGSVITYVKRYSAAAFLGIASDEDNDGQAPEIATPKTMCSDCHKPIIPEHGLTAEKIASSSEKVYGRKLCYACSLKAKAAKETVSK